MKTARDMLNKVAMSGPLKVENLPYGYVPAFVELLTAGREDIPSTRSIKACSIYIHQLCHNIRINKVKLLKKRIHFPYILPSFLSNVNRHGIVTLEQSLKVISCFLYPKYFKYIPAQVKYVFLDLLKKLKKVKKVSYVCLQ